MLGELQKAASQFMVNIVNVGSNPLNAIFIGVASPIYRVVYDWLRVELWHSCLAYIRS